MSNAVSIIIPAFRAESFIARAVKSVLAQTWQDFELIIASDDGQDYLAILEAQGISDLRIHGTSTDGVGMGSSAARNSAVHLARNRIIASLDCDDEFMPHHLENLVPKAMEQGLAISQIEYRDHATGKLLHNRAKPYRGGPLALEEVLLTCLHTYTSIVFDRKHAPHQWNERVRLLEDVVFLAECYNNLPAVCYMPEASYRYYKRDDSQCNADDAAKRFMAAGATMLELLDTGGIPTPNEHVGKVLRAYVERNNAVEHAFEQALSLGLVMDYQDFIGRNLDMLHTPLI